MSIDLKTIKDSENDFKSLIENDKDYYLKSNIDKITNNCFIIS